MGAAPSLDLDLISFSLVFLRLPLDTLGRGVGDMAVQVVADEGGVFIEQVRWNSGFHFRNHLLSPRHRLCSSESRLFVFTVIHVQQT